MFDHFVGLALKGLIKFSLFHFADDTCILDKPNSVDKINKTLKDFKDLSFWLNANKIALDATKTEVGLFKKKRKANISKLNLKLFRKKLPAV